MSKLISHKTQVFKKTSNDIAVPVSCFEDDSLPAELPQKREHSRLELEQGFIKSTCQGAQTVFGDLCGKTLESIAADKALLAFKLTQLKAKGSVEIRVIDSLGQIFWARLTGHDAAFELEDIDLQKNFELDCEDELQEMERTHGPSFATCIM